MKLKLLWANLTLAVLIAGQAVGLPGSTTSPSSGGGSTDDKSYRSQEYNSSADRSDHTGAYEYNEADAETKDGGDDPTTAVPEPGTIILMSMGLAGAAYLKRRKDKMNA